MQTKRGLCNRQKSNNILSSKWPNNVRAFNYSYIFSGFCEGFYQNFTTNLLDFLADILCHFLPRTTVRGIRVALRLIHRNGICVCVCLCVSRFLRPLISQEAIIGSSCNLQDIFQGEIEGGTFFIFSIDSPVASYFRSDFRGVPRCSEV